MRPRVRASGAALALAALGLVLAFACSGGGDDGRAPAPAAPAGTAQPRTETSPTPSGGAQTLPLKATTRPAPPTMTPTAPAVPTATSTPTPAAHAEEADPETVVLPFCNPAPRDHRGSGLGTVPYPTPAPTAGAAGGDVAGFAAAMAPILDSAAHFTRAADAAWAEAESPGEMAAVLATEGRRLWQLCSAAATAPEAAPAGELRAAIEQALIARRAALSDGLEALRAAPDDLPAAGAGRADTSRALLGLPGRLDRWMRANGIDPSTLQGYRTVSNGLLRLSMEAPPGWVVVRNQIDLVVAAPPRLQLAGRRELGPDGWELGTALKVRQIPDLGPSTLAAVPQTVDSLLSRLGRPAGEKAIEVGGAEGLLRVYPAPNAEWVTLAAAVVHGNAIYLLELGCPGEMESQCRAFLAAFAASIRWDGP